MHHQRLFIEGKGKKPKIVCRYILVVIVNILEARAEVGGMYGHYMFKR